MIPVSSRARSSEDRAGDPLDGLVNLFDLGIVLSVAFLLAALASLHVTLSHLDRSSGSPVTVPPGQVTKPVPPASGKVVGNGTEVGKVYRLSDGRLVYVVPSQDATP